MKAKEDQDIPAKVRDELRRVITVHAYGLVWTKTGMKLAEQELDVFKTFHGDAVSERSSHKDMLCKAQGKPKRVSDVNFGEGKVLHIFNLAPLQLQEACEVYFSLIIETIKQRDCRYAIHDAIICFHYYQ